MEVLYLVLYLVAAICFALTAVPMTQARPALLPLGLLAWVLVYVIKTALGFH